jgi:hypothetical protein
MRNTPQYREPGVKELCYCEQSNNLSLARYKEAFLQRLIWEDGDRRSKRALFATCRMQEIKSASEDTVTSN